jgi:hypothetical protein
MEVVNLYSQEWKQCRSAHHYTAAC